VASDRADAVVRFIRAQRQKVWPIGEVVKGSGKTRLVP
jgi:hypothetical protein